MRARERRKTIESRISLSHFFASFTADSISLAKRPTSCTLKIPARAVDFLMEKKRNPSVVRRTAEADELDAVNARLRRKGEVRRSMEAEIEERAKKRRSEEKPASSSWTKP